MSKPKTIGDLIREKLAGSPGAIKLERAADPTDGHGCFDDDEPIDGVEPECVDQEQHDAEMCCCFNTPIEEIGWE